MSRPKYTLEQRKQQLLWRIQSGKRCRACYRVTLYEGFRRDMRRIDECRATCIECETIQRHLARAGLSRHWPAIRLALRQHYGAKVEGRDMVMPR